MIEMRFEALKKGIEDNQKRMAMMSKKHATEEQLFEVKNLVE
jgi:hypothetical protein